MYNNIQTWKRNEQVIDDAIDNQQLPVERRENSTNDGWTEHHERLKRRSPAFKWETETRYGSLPYEDFFPKRAKF